MHTLIGNHDIFWKEKLAVNSPDLLLKDFDNIHIHQSPTKIKLGELNIDMIPWICKENESSKRGKRVRIVGDKVRKSNVRKELF